eukprot:3357518-Alexandrium_andersonii.AAC.1
MLRDGARRGLPLWHTPVTGTPLRPTSTFKPAREPPESIGLAALGAVGAPIRAEGRRLPQG